MLRTDQVVRYVAPDGRLHPTLKTVGATQTARMSSASPNIQNFSKSNPRIRGLMIPEDGHVLISADFDQVELRVVAALAGESRMIDAIRRGDDLHQMTADIIGKDRSVGKMVNFLIVYGGGRRALAEQAGIPVADAADALHRFRTAYPRIAELAEHMGGYQDHIRTVSGRRLEVGRTPDGLPRAYANINYLVQSSARDLLVEAWYRLTRDDQYRDAVWYPIHDELILQVPEAAAEQTLVDVQSAMTFTFFGVPITASAAVLRDEAGVSRWGK